MSRAQSGDENTTASQLGPVKWMSPEQLDRRACKLYKSFNLIHY